jgi:hypothetical protein
VAKTIIKKKKKPIARAKLEKLIAEKVEEFQEASERRLEIANESYRAQDEKTRLVIDAIQEYLMQGASGTIRVYVGSEAFAATVDMEYVEYNTLYVATEILKDLALLDVKIANYAFPKGICTECGAKVKAKKKKVKR